MYLWHTQTSWRWEIEASNPAGWSQSQIEGVVVDFSLNVEVLNLQEYTLYLAIFKGMLFFFNLLYYLTLSYELFKHKKGIYLNKWTIVVSTHKRQLSKEPVVSLGTVLLAACCKKHIYPPSLVECIKNIKYKFVWQK